MPIDYTRYPADWFTRIRPAILERAQHACEGSPRYPDCRAANRQPHPVTGKRVILTVGHHDHNTMNSDFTNLSAWCQKCHCTYDAPMKAEKRRLTVNALGPL